MFEKVNPSHPDKVADRIAGAIVDAAYEKDPNPRIAVEVLIGHGACHIIAETSVTMLGEDRRLTHVYETVHRIAGDGVAVDYREYPQDAHLAENQANGVRCGDNGIFRGTFTTDEQRELSRLMRDLYKAWPTDGKAVIRGNTLTICQSNAKSAMVAHSASKHRIAGHIKVNPLGEWTGGTDVDAGATNRKLGSDMGDSATGGGLHGKDLSKADVAVNIVCHVLANEFRTLVSACCSIGDKEVTFDLMGQEPMTFNYATVMGIARGYVQNVGGFEKFAEWGLI